jgi:cyclase
LEDRENPIEIGTAMHNTTRAVPILLLAYIFLVTGADSAHAQSLAEPPFTLKQIGLYVWAAIDNPKAKAPASANAGFVIGDDGVVVIDTFASADAAKELLVEIRKITKLPVKFVVNTHYHVDHVAGNAIFADVGAVVLAQRNVPGWIHPENLNLMGPGIKPELKAFVEALRAPVVGYDGGVDLYLGARAIHVRSFPGHTGGDSVVLVPDANVAFGGDLFWRDMVPNTIDSSTKPWIDTLDSLLKNAAGYTFVPGHGEVGSAQDVAAFRQYLATVQKLVTDARAQGKSGGAIAEAVLPALTEKYGQWEYFKYLATLNIQQMDAELSGKKRIPGALPAK